jgi:hypothetical protein
MWSTFIKSIYQKNREVHASIQGEVERSPEPAIHFHEIEFIRRRVPSIFHHCYALPAQISDLSNRILMNGGMPPALSKRRYTARVRHFVQTAMHELRKNLAIPE